MVIANVQQQMGNKVDGILDDWTKPYSALPNVERFGLHKGFKEIFYLPMLSVVP